MSVSSDLQSTQPLAPSACHACRASGLSLCSAPRSDTSAASFRSCVYTGATSNVEYCCSSAHASAAIG